MLVRLPQFFWAQPLGVALLVPLTAAGAVSDLSVTVLDAPISIEPIDESQLTDAREQLAHSLEVLERRIGSSLLDGWRDYLDWDTLKRFASGDEQAKLADLQASVDRLSSGAPGLEVDAFQRVHRDARRLFDLLLVSTLPNPGKFIKAQTKQIAQRLEQDPQLLNPRASFAVEQRLDLFSGIPSAQPVAERVLKVFSKSNLYINASEKLIDRTAGQPVSEQRPVQEVILGTSIRGAGDTHGWLGVSLLPSDASARLMFHMTGDVYSTTLGTNGPACIRSSSNTCFTGGKEVNLTHDAFTAAASEFDARTSSRTKSVSKRGGDFGEKIVVAVAKRRIAEQKACADSIAGQRAELRLEEGFNERIDNELRTARRRFEEELLAPFDRRHAPPRRIAFRTTNDELELEMLHAARGQLASESNPPPAPTADMAVRVHQSGANNLAAAILGGATLSKQQAGQPARLDAPMPEWAKNLPGLPAKEREASSHNFKPWSLTFRRGRPISFRFDRGEVDVLLHVARMQVEEDAFDSWDLILKFRVVQVDGEWVLERVGEVDALPTSFDPASGRGLRGAQVGFRANLKKQLNQQSDGKPALPTEIPLRPIKLRNGRGLLNASSLASDAGWLSVAWVLE